MRGLIGAVGVCLVLIVLFLGAWLLLRKPRYHEMTTADVALYRRAARLLSRMVNTTDLNDLSGDILSPGTLQDIEAWIADYKKELKKNAR